MTPADFADPLAVFTRWMDEGRQTEPNDHDAMALATADAAGRPSVRIVLLKSWDARGFVVYTNKESRKGRELLQNAHAAGVVHHKSRRRQLRIEGPVEELTDAESDVYFATRPRTSCLGAWASLQSRPMAGRFEFERRLAEATARYALGPVPRPPHWGGFRIRAEAIEFWEDRAFRLHLRFSCQRAADGWSVTELYP